MSRWGYVVLGDVVASREIDDREAFRDTVEAALATVNERYAADVAATFALVKGIDEMAGVLGGPTPLYGVLRDIVSAVRPGAVRFGVTYGEIDVGAGEDTVVEMDGPAFHRADEALATVAETDLYVAFDGRAPEVDPFVETALNLLLMAREDWTDRQREVVHAYEEAGTQRAVAERLDVSQQVVSATLRRADWRRIERLEARVNDALEGYGSGRPNPATTEAGTTAEVEDGGG